MDNDPNYKSKSIIPPKVSKARGLSRAAVDGAVEALPGGAFLTGIYRLTHPPKADQNREQWEEAISERTNQHDARLDRHDSLLTPTETISGLPARLIEALIKDCPDGMASKDYDLEHLSAIFPDEDKQALKDAVFDIRVLGLLRTEDYIGGWWASLTEAAYEQLDHQIMGWDTETDAVQIARIMIEDSTGHTPELHNKTGWSKRRFNPAFRLLLALFPEGRIRRVIQPDYPSLGVALADEDRANLRRLIAKAPQA